MHKTMVYYMERGVVRAREIMDALEKVGISTSVTFAPTTNPDLADMIIFADADRKLIAAKYYGQDKLLVSDFWLLT